MPAEIGGEMEVQITFFSSAGEDILAEYLHGVSHCSQ